jgi:hypothetical protein
VIVAMLAMKASTRKSCVRILMLPQTSRHDLVKNADGSIDLYYGPTAPQGKEKNWVQTIPAQGWWVYLRFYAPTRAYFDKTWSMGDFEKIK